jgi:hypothetical protein
MHINLIKFSLSLLVFSHSFSILVSQKTRKPRPSKPQNENLNIFPKLIYMAPNEADEFTINERNSFTNQLKFGWIFKANENIDLLFYLLVEEKINSFDDIESSYVYFTTNKLSCNITEPEVFDSKSEILDNQNYIFKLEFLDDRSKLYHNSLVKDRKKFRRLMPRNANITNANNQNRHNNTMLVAHSIINFEHVSSKYYACVSFTKKIDSSDPISNSTKNLKFVHQGEKNIWTHVITKKDMMPLYLVIIIYVVLLMFSALCSGLNLGLMSLDLSELTLLKKIGSEKEKSYAKKIYPLRKHGNLLLCSILLGNVLVNSTSTLILGNYLDGLFAAVGSTLLIVLFGEIFPQAACSRYGLAIGAMTRFIMYGIMAITFVVAYPLSKILDFVLGKEIAISYSRDKVRELMRRAKDEKGIEETQFKLISGALDFKSKTVEQIMVHAKDVFSLDINAILDFDTFKTILYHGYSRIPVHEFTK